MQPQMTFGARRLAAVMFTDLVGSTATAQENEPSALQHQVDQEQLLRPVFKKFGGREVKSTGDGFLVEFESALRAVECGVEVQRVLGEQNARRASDPLLVRIGIHLGDVEHRDGDIFGDAVNIAARLQPLADPGGLCVSGQVYDQTKDKVDYDFESIGPVSLKGVKEPQIVYRVRADTQGPKADTSNNAGPKLAVLPLANMSPESRDEYFSDGMTEEIIAALTKVPGLSVISRTSVMQYKTQPKRLAEIGRELKVTHILEGSVRKASGNVRITVQLIDAPSDRHMWAESYDRGMEDVFSVQSEIAEKVAAALQIRLLEDSRKQLRRIPTRDPVAHTLYLKGRVNQLGDEQGMVAAIGYLKLAIERDPGFAQAHSELAAVYQQLGFFEMLPPREAFDKAEESARKAIEIDPSLGEAHTNLARTLWDRGRPAQAFREVELGLRLAPGSAQVHDTAARLYVFSRRFDRALAEGRRALELDPLSLQARLRGATWLLYAGRPAEAAAIYEELLEKDPSNLFAQGNLGLCHLRLGDAPRAIRELRRSIELSKNFAPPHHSDLVYALVTGGETDEARRETEKLIRYRDESGLGTAAIASCFASLEEPEKCLEWLELAFKEESGYLASFGTEFAFDRYRADPRFVEFFRRIGLPFVVDSG